MLLSVIVLVLLGPPTGHPNGTGLLHGPSHAFSFSAPAGWILDNESGASQGLHAVFYPEGESWHSSPVMAYARAFAKTSSISSPAALVADTLQSFRQSSPNGAAHLRETLVLSDDRVAQIYFFSGDDFGNLEAVAYISESRTINFFVLSARNEAVFQSSLAAFRDLVRSYAFFSDHVEYKPASQPTPK
jgi:hypothetical protein